MFNSHLHSDFAGFLDRLIAGKGHACMTDWEKFVVTHYADAEIEKMRCKLARLHMSWPHHDWPAVDLGELAGWAGRLRRTPLHS